MSKAAKTLYKEDLPACTPDTLDKLRALHPEGELNYSKQFRPSHEQEAVSWESEHGRNLMLDAFSLRDTRAYFRKRPALDAPDPDGWRGREHASYFFLNDDVDAQLRIVDQIAPYAKGDFHEDCLHEHAGGRLLSVFLKKDLVKIRPINNTSLQTAVAIDGASVCAKLVSMIHDGFTHIQRRKREDPRWTCRTSQAKPFFPYFRSMNDVANRNRFINREGSHLRCFASV